MMQDAALHPEAAHCFGFHASSKDGSHKGLWPLGDHSERRLLQSGHSLAMQERKTARFGGIGANSSLTARSVVDE